MTIDLTNTNASKIASALLSARRRAGSPAMMPPTMLRSAVPACCV